MKRNQIYSFEALHDVMAVYDREFGISFPRIRPKLESWDLRKTHDNDRNWAHIGRVIGDASWDLGPYYIRLPPPTHQTTHTHTHKLTHTET